MKGDFLFFFALSLLFETTVHHEPEEDLLVDVHTPMLGGFFATPHAFLYPEVS